MSQRKFRTVSKRISFDRVPVKIKKKLKFSLIYPFTALQKIFQLADFHKPCAIWVSKFTIKIPT